MSDQQPPKWALRIWAERERRGWSKHEMARQLMRAAGLSYGNVVNLARQIYDWEKGKHFPRDWSRAYATAFDTTVEKLFGVPDPIQRAVDLAGTLEDSATSDDWYDMERRRLLELLALSLGAGGLASSGEPIRQLLDIVLMSEDRSAEDWELACVDHLHALRTRPPIQVRDGLLIDLLALQRQLKKADTKDLPDLNRSAAGLSLILANALTRLGNHAAAIHWWRTAKAAADASGDLNLRLLIRAEEAGCALYGQRDISTVLALVDKARALASGPSSYWYADLAGTRAKALTLLGRHDEAKQELRTYVTHAGNEGPSTVIPTIWCPDQTHFAESWVYAAAGDEAKADAARTQVLAYNGDYQYLANVHLHEAICTVAQGGIDRGTQQATAILDALPTTHRSAMITETGKIVLRTVPFDQRDRPAVQDLRATLTATAPHTTALH
ncbi:helix-turn-helix transcriptional regulator [Actinomadura keratinilytica]|uniref:XRE family transcriptional regulator n=1 Tax=Actinomadura keratinilytica TaxID=547461 RepID=A0ABP7YU54_9ACTN